MKIATDEIFGPVQSILKFSSIEEVCFSGWQASRHPHLLGKFSSFALVLV